MAPDSEERGEVEKAVQVRRPREGVEVQQGRPEDLSRPSEKDQSPALPLSWVQIKFLSFLLSFLCDCVMAKRPVKSAAKARAAVTKLKSKLSKAQKKASKLTAACSRGKTKKSHKKSKKSKKSRRH